MLMANLVARCALFTRRNCHLRWPDQDAPAPCYSACQIGSQEAIVNEKPLSPADMHENLCQACFLFIKSCSRQLPSYYWLSLTLLTALLQHPSQFDLPESKYHGQERLFPNPAFSTNDFSFSSRRPQNPLTSGTSGVALPPNPSLDFNGNPLVSSEPP